jgi:hypothetical protein
LTLVSSTQALVPGFAVPGPHVIGATGGSGTRIVARIVRESGMYTGARLNDYEDALDFGELSDRWINSYIPYRLRGEEVPPELRTKLGADLDSVLERHAAAIPADARGWGWKEPRSIYLVPFFRERMPSFRFLHFVRDGRDMALSDNQQQLHKHGSTVLDGRVSWRRSVRSITLWSRIKRHAADHGESLLVDAYPRVRFEDLCAEPVATSSRIFEWFGLEGDVDGAAAAVRPPGTLGRWRSARFGLPEKLTRTAEPALARFGYL